MSIEKELKRVKKEIDANISITYHPRVQRELMNDFKRMYVDTGLHVIQTALQQLGTWHATPSYALIHPRDYRRMKMMRKRRNVVRRLFNAGKMHKL